VHKKKGGSPRVVCNDTTGLAPKGQPIVALDVELLLRDAKEEFDAATSASDCDVFCACDFCIGHRCQPINLSHSKSAPSPSWLTIDEGGVAPAVALPAGDPTAVGALDEMTYAP